MNKIVKYTLYGTGSVLVLGGVAIAYIAATFEPDMLKPQLEQLVKDEKQRTLKLTGPIKLSIFPNIGATLSDVSLSERNSDMPFAQITDARVSLQFWPLLSKKVVVDAVELHGASVRLVREADGKFNFADLLSKTDTPEENKPVDFDISRIRVDKVSVDFADKQNSRQINLYDLALSANGLTIKGARNVDFSTRAQLSTPKLDVQLAAKLDKLDMDTDAKRFQLDDLKANMDGKLAADTIKLNLSAPKLSLASQAASAETVNLTALLNGANRQIDAKLKLEGLSGDTKLIAAHSLALDLDAKQAGTAAKLVISSPLGLDAETLALSLSRLAIKGNITAGPAKAAPVDLSGHLNIGIKAQAVDTALAGKLDNNGLTLNASVKDFSQPTVRFDLKADAIDLDRYIVPPKPTSVAAAVTPPAKIDLSPLKPLNVDGRVSIGQMKKGQIDARDIRVALNAKNGMLVIPTATMKAFGGDIDASATATASATPHITVKPKLSGVDINAVLHQFANFDRLEGRGFVDGSLTVEGGDVVAMKNSVSGNLNAKLLDGALKGINIGKTLRDAKATLASFQGGEKTIASSQSEKTDFTELTASLQLNNGLATNKDLSIKSPLLRVNGEGEADLKTETVNYLVKAALVATSKGQEGASRDDLRGLTIPVRIKGSFAAPSYSLDLSAALKENAGAKLEEKKAEVKQELKEKANDAIKKGLKSLFK
ncbi:AsmA family protein [Chitinimonas sp. PSY-7]|uniref:AsmA family protein n=1 Tax=Chitinimonas sp. PSY-7 TaxID=3459088 RepID=UPI00403FD70D